MDSSFDGLPLDELEFLLVDWTHTQEHVEQRALRKGTTEYAPTVESATEACADPDRLVGRTTTAVVVIGYSPTAGRLLRVIVRPLHHAADGAWIGLTAHAANTRDRSRYGDIHD